jgi:hypothetical protein
MEGGDRGGLAARKDGRTKERALSLLTWTGLLMEGGLAAGKDGRTKERALSLLTWTGLLMEGLGIPGEYAARM